MTRSPLVRLVRYARALFRDSFLLLREFWGPLLALISISLGVAAIFYVFYPANTPTGRLPFDEALYLVVTLTVIEGAYAPPTQNHWLIIFYFLMPFVGLLLAGQGFANFLTLLFNRQARGQAWKVALAGTLSHHVVVCGGGRVGSNVALQLVRAGADVVLIEQELRPETGERLAKQNIVVLQGDIRDFELLNQAGVARADAVVVCTDDDLANLETAIHCRDIRPDIRIILRMFDAELARKVKETCQIEVAYSSSALGAPIFAGVALDVLVQQSFYVGDSVTSVAKLSITPGSPLDGLTVGKVEETFNLSVMLASRNGEQELHPAYDTPLTGGMNLLLLGELPVLYRFAGWVRPKQAEPIVVCGGGRVGSSVAATLAEAGADVIVIEQDSTRATTRRLEKNGIEVRRGDIRDPDVLRAAGIEQASAVVICTDDDLANLESAIYCREMNSDIRIVVRMFDAALAARVKEVFGIQAALSSSAIAAPVFAAAALDVDVQPAFTIDGVAVSIARLVLRPDAQLNGMTLRRIEESFDVTIIFVSQEGVSEFYPAPSLTVQNGTMMLALGEVPALQRLGAWARARP